MKPEVTAEFSPGNQQKATGHNLSFCPHLLQTPSPPLLFAIRCSGVSFSGVEIGIKGSTFWFSAAFSGRKKFYKVEQERPLLVTRSSVLLSGHLGIRRR